MEKGPVFGIRNFAQENSGFSAPESPFHPKNATPSEFGGTVETTNEVAPPEDRSSKNVPGQASRTFFSNAFRSDTVFFGSVVDAIAKCAHFRSENFMRLEGVNIHDILPDWGFRSNLPERLFLDLGRNFRTIPRIVPQPFTTMRGFAFFASVRPSDITKVSASWQSRFPGRTEVPNAAFFHGGVVEAMPGKFVFGYGAESR